MTARQNARYNMMAAVISTCEAHESDWNSFLPFSGAYTDFKAAYADIGAALQLQQGTSEGGTTSKKTARTAVATDLRILVPALQLYGRLNGDTRMVADSYTTERMHLNGAAPTYGNHAARLVAMAQAVNVQPSDDKLAAYGAPKTFLTALAGKISTFNGLIGEPRHQKAESVRGTKDLDAAFDVADDILEERMDPAADVLGATTAPAFHSEYRTAREIVDAGFNVRELTVTIRDAVTADPLAGVLCLITPGEIGKTTADGGGFYIDDLDGGDYSMTLTRAGYVSKTVSFTIVDGQATVKEYTMTKEGGGGGD